MGGPEPVYMGGTDRSDTNQAPRDPSRVDVEALAIESESPGREPTRAGTASNRHTRDNGDSAIERTVR